MMDVVIEGVRVERGERFVLDVPSLVLRGGRTTAILGPNGSGKTTLLRLIAGLQRVRAGRILGGGAPIEPRHVAFVFQEEVFLRQSVRDNLELGLRLRGVDRGTMRARIAEAADLLGIAHLLDRRADHLSGGEGRRVGFARALCLRAPLALLDEPLAGLDERTYTRLLDELPRLLSAFDATTLLVTHDRREALRLAQDLVVLVDGRVLAAGDKREVAANPLLRKVAEVLGWIVLTMDDRLVAVPPGAMKVGAGAFQFTIVVDDVLDLVESREIAGRIGDVRARITIAEGAAAPSRGDRVLVHAEHVCPVS